MASWSDPDWTGFAWQTHRSSPCQRGNHRLDRHLGQGRTGQQKRRLHLRFGSSTESVSNPSKTARRTPSCSPRSRCQSQYYTIPNTNAWPLLGNVRLLHRRRLARHANVRRQNAGHCQPQSGSSRTRRQRQPLGATCLDPRIRLRLRPSRNHLFRFRRRRHAHHFAGCGPDRARPARKTRRWKQPLARQPLSRLD